MVSPLFNQSSPLPSNSIFSKPTPRSDKPNIRKSLIIWTKPELQTAIKSLEDESIRTTKSSSHQSLYNSLISSCIRHKALDEGDRLRAHMEHASFHPTVFLNNQFINLYSRCGDSHKARKVFDEMPERNIVSWNAMIAGYCSNALFFDALALLKMMMEDGIMPDYLTYLSALRASSNDPQIGEQVHALVIKHGLFFSCIEIGNALINFYSKIGDLLNAQSVFKGMVSRDDVSWNSIITANSKNGNFDRAMALLVEMQEEDEVSDEFTFGSLLAMEDTSYTKKLHSQIIKKDLGSNVFVSSALLDSYSRHGNPRDAMRVFDSMINRNAASWNSAISAYINTDAITEGLQLFIQMLESEVIPDNYTISILLKAAITSDLSIFTSKQLHGLAFKMGIWEDTTIGNNLIILYGNRNMIKESIQSFADISDPDLISWNSMIQAHIDNKEYDNALTLYIEMKQQWFGFDPDRFTFVSAMAASPCIKTGRQIHCDLIKSGLPIDDFTGSSLIDMYAKSMAAEDAKKVFDGMKKNKDLITWNSMIVGFSQNGYLDEVLKLLIQMKEEGKEPDNFTYASILSACANATAIEQGKQVHAQILKSDLDLIDTALTNALITLYFRSGITSDAEKVFSTIHQKTVVTWTSMISGYAQNGYSKKALNLFNQMEVQNANPNAKTFIALLTACSHGGFSNAAINYFKTMEMKHGIKPGFDHYACMVDILGRAGRLEEAEEIIEGMPYSANALVWRMLLSGCRIHGDLERGERSMRKIVELEPDDSAAFVLLSNLYTELGFEERAGKVRKMMKEKGIKKEAGKSWIEVRNRVYGFVAGDVSNSRAEEIYLELKLLMKSMRDEGYEPGNSAAILGCKL